MEGAERPMIPHNTPRRLHYRANEIELTAEEVITSIPRRNENILLRLLLLQVGSFACLGPYSSSARRSMGAEFS